LFSNSSGRVRVVRRVLADFLAAFEEWPLLVLGFVFSIYTV
jgi:hypothetical protein